MQTADVWRGAVARDGGGDAGERPAAFDGEAGYPFETGVPADGDAGAHGRSVVGEALVVDVRGTPFELREKAAFAQSGWPHVMLHAVVEGRPVDLNGRGEQATLKPGHLVIRRSNERAVIRSDRFARVITVVVAQHLLVPRYASADALEDYFVEADNTLPQRLLYSFIVGLVDAEGAAGLKQMTIIDALGGPGVDDPCPIAPARHAPVGTGRVAYLRAAALPAAQLRQPAPDAVDDGRRSVRLGARCA